MKLEKITSIDQARNYLRKIQELLFTEDVDNNQIFKITTLLDQYIDEIAVKTYGNKK